MTKRTITNHDLKDELLAHVAQHGFVLDGKTYNAVTQELSYETPKHGAATLNYRFKNWLDRNGVIPGDTPAARISPALATEWIRAAESNPDYATIVDAFVTHAPRHLLPESVWQKAEVALRTAQEAEKTALVENYLSEQQRQKAAADARQHPDALVAHAKQHGLSLNAAELSAAFSALTEISRRRLLVTVGSATGRHGNRHELPQSLQLSPAEFTSLENALGEAAIRRLARGITGLYNEAEHGSAETRLAEERKRAQERQAFFGGRTV